MMYFHNYRMIRFLINNQQMLHTVQSPSRFYLEVAAAWTDPDNIPGIDLSASMDMPAGSFIMPFNTILDLVSAIGSQFVSSGLVQLDLHSDGLFAAKYHEVVVLSLIHILQEVMDLAGVAHIVALKSRVPYLHFFDGFRCV